MMSLGVLAGMAGDCDVLREPIAVAKTLGGSRIFKRLFLCVFIFPPRTVTALAAPAGYGSRFLADFSCQIINLPQRHFSRSNIREWIETAPSAECVAMSARFLPE